MWHKIFIYPGQVANKLFFYLVLVVLISGCGGGSDSDSVGSKIAANLSGDDIPNVTIAVSSAKVKMNGDTTLNWTSNNVESCSATDSWSGNKKLKGTQVIEGLKSNSKFSINCSGSNGNASASVDVVVDDSVADAHTLSMAASPINLPYNGSTTLTWTSTNANSCSAAGGWSGSKSGSGSQTINSLSSNTIFSLSCTGSVGSVTDQVDILVSPPIAGPLVNLSASPLNVAYNGSTLLTWTTENASNCVASGDWSGDKNLSGSKSENNLVSDTTYTLTCTGVGGTSSDSVTVSVADPPPTLSFIASPDTVVQNGSTTLSWNSSSATSCTASGDWSGNKAAIVSQVISGLTIDSQFNLACSSLGGTVNDTVSVTVVLNSTGTALMSWTPPTENTDGSQLDDLAGYRIHYGTSPGSYNTTIDIDNPGLSSYLIEGLANSVWYFSMTAVNAPGIESEFLQEVSKTIN